MSKVLFLEWSSFGNDYMINELKRQGYEVICLPFPRETEDARNSPQLTETIAMAILKESPAFVFSFNYFPVAAIACKACRTKYVSWVYDSPYILLYSKTIEYDTNRVFLFDRAEAEKFQNMGISHVYYLPMASAVTEYDELHPGKDAHQKYDADITFIGSMYSETHQHMFRHLEKLDEYTKGYLYGIMEVQKSLYGIDVMEQALTPQIVENMVKVCPVTEHGDGFETTEWVFANYFLARKVTAMERRELLSKLSLKYNVHLHTPETTPFLPKVKNMGKLDYYKEAPLAMKCAKINLNISLRSIHTGMPLRALDVLGCGGFLLTNYQADFLEYLEPERDFVYYENHAHADALVEYYLKHEDERLEIAQNGYQKIKQHLSYKKQVCFILEHI